MKKEHLIKHPSKRRALMKFLILVFILLAYFVFISAKYGLQDGWQITLLTWSFFVLCTPIADAGFILDFPVRLLTKVRMIVSEIGVWVTAISLNIYFESSHSEIYQNITLLRIFDQILTQPFPFWIVILLSASGTFLSIQFGDELMDVIHFHQLKKYEKHKTKHHFILLTFALVAVFLTYFYFLGELNLQMLNG